MKTLQQSTKESSSSTVVAGGGGHRKTKMEPQEKPSSDRRPTSAPSAKPSKVKDTAVDPSAAPPGGSIHKDQPPPVPSSLPGALTQPLATGPPIPLPDIPPPPTYGFHCLERCTIVLIDGSVRSYFALPPDGPVADNLFANGGGPGFSHGPESGFPPRGVRLSPKDFRAAPLPPYARGGPEHEQEHWARPDGPRLPVEGAPSWLKRKHVGEEELVWHRHRMLQYGNPNGGIASGSGGDPGDYFGRPGSPNNREYHDDVRLSKSAKLGGDGHEDLRAPRRLDDAAPAVLDVDPQAMKTAFLRLSKSLNESLQQRRNYLENGKNGPLKCIVCDRVSKDFATVHDLIMHAYNTKNKEPLTKKKKRKKKNEERRVDHRGLHKALCILMGWSYSKVPQTSKAYQLLSAEDARSNREDLIIWPPMVIIHNAILGRRKEGQVYDFSEREMDTRLKELGFSGGESRAIFGEEGHTGVVVVRFASTHIGLEEAEKLAQHFRMDDRGRDGWIRMQSSQSGNDDQNPALIKADEKSSMKKRVLYGYLGTASDLDILDFDTRKKTMVKSKRELDLSD